MDPGSSPGRTLFLAAVEGNYCCTRGVKKKVAHNENTHMDKALGVGLLALLGVGVVGGGIAYGLSGPSTYPSSAEQNGQVDPKRGSWQRKDNDADRQEDLKEPRGVSEHVLLQEDLQKSQNVPEQVLLRNDSVPINEGIPTDAQVEESEETEEPEETKEPEERNKSFADVVRKIRYANPQDSKTHFYTLEDSIMDKTKHLQQTALLKMMGAKQNGMTDVYKRYANDENVASVPMFGPTDDDSFRMAIIKDKLKGLNPEDGQFFFDEAEQMIKNSGLNARIINRFLKQLQQKRHQMQPQAPPMD